MPLVISSAYRAPVVSTVQHTFYPGAEPLSIRLRAGPASSRLMYTEGDLSLLKAASPAAGSEVFGQYSQTLTVNFTADGIDNVLSASLDSYNLMKQAEPFSFTMNPGVFSSITNVKFIGQTSSTLNAPLLSTLNLKAISPR